MMQGHPATTVTLPSERAITITRMFRAPRPLVFDTWTTPRHLVRWWGPHGFTLIVCEIDLRAGGLWRYVMRGPAGEEVATTGQYQEVVAPERLTYTSGFESATMPQFKYQVTCLFTAVGDTTLVTLTHHYANQAERDTIIDMQMVQGMDETFEKLEDLLERSTTND